MKTMITIWFIVRRICILNVCLLMVFMSTQIFAGNHYGENKWLSVDVEYSGMLYLDENGLPVYKQGGKVKYEISMTNEGDRKYNNFQVRTMIKYAEDIPGCAQKGDLLPGSSVSEWIEFTLDKQETLTPPLSGSYNIPALCSPLVKIYLELEVRHDNNGEGDSAGVFVLFRSAANAQQTNEPDNFTLFQNNPNPFNPSTKINYSISQQGYVTLKVYDILGNEIETLINEEKPAGSYEIEFDGRKLSSGVYFYQLRAGDFIQTKKMVLMK
ncbi:MAG: T9SS type A sorting domain-containing protein [Ignavibacteriaceae bacterium]